MIFNDLIDLGDMEPTMVLVLNILVLVHLVAFIALIGVVVYNMRKSEQTIFVEQVKKMERTALENKKK